MENILVVFCEILLCKQNVLCYFVLNGNFKVWVGGGLGNYVYTTRLKVLCTCTSFVIKGLAF